MTTQTTTIDEQSKKENKTEHFIHALAAANGILYVPGYTTQLLRSAHIKVTTTASTAATRLYELGQMLERDKQTRRLLRNR